MAFKLPPLPWEKDSLNPHISPETIEYHYGKHHAGYVSKLNAAVASNKNLEGKTLEDLIKSEKGKVFNLAAQTYNHTFYWNSLAPKAGGKPSGKIGKAIDDSFGSFDQFKKLFNEKASLHFGSGWAWLVREKDSNKLSVVDTHDAGCPLVDGKVPVLTCDVWEHAYYVDYRNDRGKYLESWWNLVNWKFAESNLL